MSRLKGRYVAQVIIEFDDEYVSGDMLPFDEISDRFKNTMTPALRELIQDETGATKVTVDQQYADINLVEVDNVDSDQ